MSGLRGLTLHRLTPRTLSSRLVIVAALSLLVAQVISLALLLREHRQQWITLTTAPAALRIIDALDTNPAREHEFRGPGRVETTTTAPRPTGHPEPAIANKAKEFLTNSGVSVQNIAAYVDNDPPRRHPRMHERLSGPGRDIGRLTLAVQVAPDRWLTATSRARKGAPMITRFLFIQTVLIYAIVLIPLLWIGRRLSAPLGSLTDAARDFSPTSATAPLPENGPDDVRDLTRAFNEMQGRIGAMLAEKDHMLGAIGHDLRTPLASLRVRIESVDDAEERDQMVGTIEEMRQMLDDILALARVGRDRQPPQRLDLATLAEAVTDDFRAMGLDAEMGDSERAVVSVHASALRRALRNLVDNAIKYGGMARVSVHNEGRDAVVRVEDGGPGIDPARMQEMLEPFTRLEGSRSKETGGVGLGLALVRAVMRAEGGDIRLINRTQGTGLIAELILPLAKG